MAIPISQASPPPVPVAGDRERVAELRQARDRIHTEIGKRVIGQREVIDHLLITLFARGHGLFVGVPGLAKTLLIQTLADVLDLSFNRIQFTPDLMPSDITGTDILETDAAGGRAFRFIKGPVFCNILLADEINRTPPKTQAALLQSMQEQRVTAGGRTYPLDAPFHVFATQNPIEQEGTYPLPEAQLDRFMMMLHVDYPSAVEEAEIVRRTTSAPHAQVAKILGPQEILAFQDLVMRVPISEPSIELAVRLVRRTRPDDPQAPAEVKEFVTYGAGPRASQHIVLAAKARAILDGRPVVDGSDIKALAYPVLRHRVLTNFHAEARKVSADDIVAKVLEGVV
ncbi:MAG: AAA family ATPase [Myxococcota bacterium]|nr:MoxR family ATPase [Myxococcota bacterium]